MSILESRVFFSKFQILCKIVFVLFIATMESKGARLSLSQREVITPILSIGYQSYNLGIQIPDIVGMYLFWFHIHAPMPLMHFSQI